MLKQENQSTTSKGSFINWEKGLKNTPSELDIIKKSIQTDTNPPVVSIVEYRQKLKDNKSADQQIEKRLRYLETFCRELIKQELENYVAKKS